MAEFFNMDGYAAFVWTAYGVSAISLVRLALSSLRQLKNSAEAVNAARARRKGKA